MHKKFEINRTKIKGGRQSEIKVITHNSKSDLPLSYNHFEVGGEGQTQIFKKFLFAHSNSIVEELSQYLMTNDSPPRFFKRVQRKQ